ncbi:hypothetical protein NHONHO_42 [Mycobacterium phage Nhonho]|uniref:hypothetical protein n=1 Tax=Mycobacterium phage Barriga TaxID=1675548 RepID=UPI0006A2ADB7|nr:hypothetical protein BARRIGA_42 [Mycobacterium phage Barriga]YP_009199837.1 hypothetical protein NHONHO_42 [Mycobacterium phage Nhonho]AKU44911.1 hypothetical protein BARRIGA_42 [Mycobacterium phage Barriga]AKU45438.1 hypothetical protein NHONHO_42 [Mycobacterium phage Nhonho]
MNIKGEWYWGKSKHAVTELNAEGWIFTLPPSDNYIGRHRLPDVRFSQELPGGTVYWSVNRKNFFRRDDSLPSGWVQRIYPRVATSFRTAE